MILNSKVKGFEGPCKLVWLNDNAIHKRELDDSASIGFFRRVRRIWWWPRPVCVGEEFFGVIRNGEVKEFLDVPDIIRLATLKRVEIEIGNLLENAINPLHPDDRVALEDLHRQVVQTLKESEDPAQSP